MGSALSSPSSTAQVRIACSHVRDSSNRSTTLRYMPRPRPARSLTGTGSDAGLQRRGALQHRHGQPAPEPAPVQATFVSAFASRSAGGAAMASSRSTARSAWNRSDSGAGRAGLGEGGVAARQQQRVVAGLGHRLLAPARRRSRRRSPRRRSSPRSSSPRTRARPGRRGVEAASSSVRARAGSPSRNRYSAASTVRRSRSSGVVRRRPAQRQLGELGRGVDAAAAAGVPGRGVEGGGDDGRRLGRAQRGVPGALLRIGHRRGQPPCSARRAVGRQVRVRDRRDQRVGEPDALTVDLEEPGRDGFGQARAAAAAVRRPRRSPRRPSAGPAPRSAAAARGSLGQAAQPLGDQQPESAGTGSGSPTAGSAPAPLQGPRHLQAHHRVAAGRPVQPGEGRPGQRLAQPVPGRSAA